MNGKMMQRFELRAAKLLACFLPLLWATFALGQQTVGTPTGEFGTTTSAGDIDLATLAVTVKVPIQTKIGLIPLSAYT